MDFLHPSITEIPEANLVQRLMARVDWRGVLIGNVWFPKEPLDFQAKSLSLFPGSSRGDIDLLLVPKAQPELSVAIQVKRIKVRGTRINKLHEFEEGINQTKVLAKMGFSQVYLFILVVIDSREQNAGKYSYAGPDTKTRSTIVQAISYSNKFDPRVGLVHYDFVQSMDREPLGVGRYGGHLVRRAEVIAQPPALTNAIASLVKNSGEDHQLRTN